MMAVECTSLRHVPCCHGESPTYILNTDTHPVIRTMGYHTQLENMRFDEIFN